MIRGNVDSFVKEASRPVFHYVVTHVPSAGREETASEGSCKKSKELLKADLLEDLMFAPSLLRVLGK